MKWIAKLPSWTWKGIKWLVKINIRFYLWLWSELKDVHTLLLFIVVFLVMSSEIWVPVIISFITKNGWWLTISGTCLAFWLGPFTPFWTICIAVTFGIKAFFRFLFRRKQKRQAKAEEAVSGLPPDASPPPEDRKSE